MTRPAANNLRRISVALLVSLSMTTGAVAAPKESVQRVTADYKQWVRSHDVVLEDRVRILLKPDRILVSLEHERGKTRLTYTADGTELLSEVTIVEARVVAEATCRFFCRDDDDDRGKRKKSSSGKIVTASLAGGVADTKKSEKPKSETAAETAKENKEAEKEAKKKAEAAKKAEAEKEEEDDREEAEEKRQKEREKAEKERAKEAAKAEKEAKRGARSTDSGNGNR